MGLRANQRRRKGDYLPFSHHRKTVLDPVTSGVYLYVRRIEIMRENTGSVLSFLIIFPHLCHVLSCLKRLKNTCRWIMDHSCITGSFIFLGLHLENLEHEISQGFSSRSRDCYDKMLSLCSCSHFCFDMETYLASRPSKS